MIFKNESIDNPEVPILTFEVGWEQFSIELLEIKEIVQAGQIRRLPKALEFIDGVYNYRGNIIHIVNLKKKLRLNEYVLYHSKLEYNNNGNGSNRRFFMILNINNKDLGVLVDNIVNVSHIKLKDIIGLSPIFQTSIGLEYIKGIVKFNDRPRILINMKKILSEVEQKSIQKEISTLK